MQRFVIQADLVGSRKISERAKFAQTLKAALKEVNRKYGSALQAALEITKGIDELSAVIRDPAVAPSMILDLAIRIHPHAFRVVLVHGEVDIVSPLQRANPGDREIGFVVWIRFGPRIHRSGVRAADAPLSGDDLRLAEQDGDDCRDEAAGAGFDLAADGVAVGD
jgi:flagellar hook-basal body complex protein FliE